MIYVNFDHLRDFTKALWWKKGKEREAECDKELWGWDWSSATLLKMYFMS